MPKREPPTWDLVLKRNSVERLKRELFPTELWGQWHRLAETSYEKLPEEDIVRLQWYGLYHDKPKIGTFMMRVKIPGGILTPAGLRTIGEISERIWPRPGRTDHPPEHPTALHNARPFPGDFRKAQERRPDHTGRMRRRGAQYHRMPGRRRGSGGVFRRDRPAGGGGRLLLRQSRLFRPAAQAQDHRFRRAITSATRRRSIASRWSGSSRTVLRGSRCGSAVDSPPPRACRAIWAYSCTREEAMRLAARDHRRVAIDH